MSMDIDQAISELKHVSNVSTWPYVKDAVSTVLARIQQLEISLGKHAQTPATSELIGRIADLNAEIARLKQPETEVEQKAWQLYSAGLIRDIGESTDRGGKAWCFEAAQDFINWRDAKRKESKP